MTHSPLFANPAPLTVTAPSTSSAPTASAVAVRMGWLPDGLTSHFLEIGNVLPIQARAEGEDTAVLALTWLDEAQAVFARADSGIHGVTDLAGKRLGLPLGDGL